MDLKSSQLQFDDLPIREVVFDPSLLTPIGLKLSAGLAEEGTTFHMTPHMREVLENSSTFLETARLWRTEKLTRSFELFLQNAGENILLEDVGNLYPNERKVLTEALSSKRTTPVGLTRSFLADEILLGIEKPPILCLKYSTPSQPKIVSFLRKIGARVVSSINLELDEKAKFFGTKKFSKAVLAMAGGATFVYLIVGGVPAISFAGGAGIRMILVDQ